MVCLKCGREVGGDAVFCPDCLEDMEKYPVRPGTVVQLPKRPAVSPAKKTASHRHQPSPEEQIRKLKRRVAVLTCLLLVTVVMVVGLCWRGIVEYYDNLDVLLPGQNYSSAENPNLTGEK